MKIAYGTYAMPTIPLEEAFPILAQIGYDGVEICISPKHVGSLPEEMDVGRRMRLRGLLADNRLGIPALFVTGALWTRDAGQHEANMRLISSCAQLARDLGMREPPVLAMGIGGGRDEWGDIRNDLVARLQEYGRLAEREDFILAAEAHFGAAVCNSERAIWLFESVGHPRVKMHFDIIHMFLAGEKEADAVARLVPYTVHTHITDAIRNPDGSFRLVLLGEGELDAAAYVRAMRDAGWDDFITLEVSMMVWGAEGYHPVAAAKESYEAITRAFEAAGVLRS